MLAQHIHIFDSFAYAYRLMKETAVTRDQMDGSTSLGKQNGNHTWFLARRRKCLIQKGQGNLSRLFLCASNMLIFLGGTLAWREMPGPSSV